MHRIGIDIAFGGISNPRIAYDHYLNYYFERARDKYEHRDYIAARQELEDILTVYPDHLLSKEYLEKIGQSLDVIEQQQEVKIDRLLRKAMVAFSENNLAKASRYYRLVLRMDPENATAIEGLGNIEEFVQSFKENDQQKGNKTEIEQRFEEAEALYRKGEYVQAREKFEELIAVAPDNLQAHKYLEEINSQLAKITALQINDLYLKGVDFFNKGDFREAMKYFSAVSIAAPERLDAQGYLVECQNNIKQEEEKKNSREIAQKQDKIREEVSSAYNVALQLYENGNYEEAVKAFARSKELAVQYDFDKYVEDSRKYISASKNAIAEKHFKQGFEYAQKNKIESAAYEYRKSLENNPDHASAKAELERISNTLSQQYYEQGMNVFARGETEKAKELFKKSLYYKPDKLESLRALERIR
jgi:tetratricopeptide (TPR) repeat protein